MGHAHGPPERRRSSDSSEVERGFHSAACIYEGQVRSLPDSLHGGGRRLRWVLGGRSPPSAGYDRHGRLSCRVCGRGAVASLAHQNQRVWRRPQEGSPGLWAVAAPAGWGVTRSARARLADAEAFLEAAATATNPDVIATNAIHAAIAADTICCVALRERSADANHTAAVELLAEVDGRLSATLARALSGKTQAVYETRDVSTGDAATCARQAPTVLAAARTRAHQA